MSRELAAATGAGPRPALACMQRYQQLAEAAGKEARQFGTEEGVARLAGLVASHGSSWKVCLPAQVHFLPACAVCCPACVPV